MIVTIKDVVVEYRMADETLKILDIPKWSVDKGDQIAVSA